MSEVSEAVLIECLRVSTAKLLEPFLQRRSCQRIENRLRRRSEIVAGSRTHLVIVHMHLRVPLPISSHSRARFRLRLPRPIAIHVEVVMVITSAWPALLL